MRTCSADCYPSSESWKLRPRECSSIFVQDSQLIKDRKQPLSQSQGPALPSIVGEGEFSLWLHDKCMMKEYISINPVNKIMALSAQEGDLALQAHWGWDCEWNKPETQAISQQSPQGTRHGCRCSCLASNPFPATSSWHNLTLSSSLDHTFKWRKITVKNTVLINTWDKVIRIISYFEQITKSIAHFFFYTSPPWARNNCRQPSRFTNSTLSGFLWVLFLLIS